MFSIGLVPCYCQVAFCVWKMVDIDQFCVLTGRQLTNQERLLCTQIYLSIACVIVYGNTDPPGVCKYSDLKDREKN